MKKICGLEHKPQVTDHSLTAGISEYRWYQCDIIRKNGDREFYSRFIASSYQKAEDRIASIVHNIHENPVKNWFYKLASKRYIKRFDIYRVPQHILDNYNFMRDGDTDKFYNRVNG